MNKLELEDKLREFGCLDRYSLDGSLDPDRYVLYHNYSKWEYFFFNEKGGRDYIKTFFRKKKLMIIFIRMHYVGIIGIKTGVSIMFPKKYRKKKP